jgi:phosphopantetheinyl transferase
MIVTIASCLFSTPETLQLIETWATFEDRRHAGTRPASLAARALLRRLLADVWGPGDWEIEADPQGKPWLRSPDGDRGPSISLSHSGAWVAVATVASGRLGIDIETHRPRKFDKLAAYAFGPQEGALVAAGGEAAFYRIWVLREARAKATGVGISEAASCRDQVVGDGDAWRDQSWHFAFRRLAPDLSFGLALETPLDTPIEVRWL